MLPPPALLLLLVLLLLRRLVRPRFLVPHESPQPRDLGGHVLPDGEAQQVGTRAHDGETVHPGEELLEPLDLRADLVTVTVTVVGIGWGKSGQVRSMMYTLELLLRHTVQYCFELELVRQKDRRVSTFRDRSVLVMLPWTVSDHYHGATIITLCRSVYRSVR